MKRYARLSEKVFGLWFTLTWCVTSTFADDTPPPWYREPPFYQELADQGHYSGLAYVMLFCFAATVIFEYPVVYFLAGRPAKARMQLFVWVLFVNVVTNPAAQIASLFINRVALESEALAWLMLGLIEVAVVIAEFGLLRWIFRRMYLRGALNGPVTARRTLLIAFLANLASFVFGLFGFV